MRRRVMAALAALACGLGLAACDSGDEASPTPEPSASSVVPVPPQDPETESPSPPPSPDDELTAIPEDVPEGTTVEPPGEGWTEEQLAIHDMIVTYWEVYD